MVEATDELRERLAKALHEAQCGCPTWVVKDLEDTQYDDMAAAIMPLVVAVVAEARTEGAIAELEAAADLILAPSEHLRDSATCCDIAYDLHERAAALRGVGNQKVGVTVDDLALDEMDGNQNAEPRWSANRLEEVLREGLPDQNAEPSDPIMAETEQMALVLAGEAAAEPNIPIAVLLERSAKAYGTTAGRMKYALTFAKVRGLVIVDYDSATVEVPHV